MDLDVNMIVESLQKGDPVAIAILAVSCLILVVSVVSLVISICLAVSYIKYNRRKNSAEITGQDACRRILDENGLQHIKVKASGSVIFGNSYSHYFKKVRLRRATWKKTSISSLAMAAQKASLAVLDKEEDPDMKRRVKLTPIISFGPLAFIPLIIIGLILDLVISNDLGIFSLICALLGLAFYVWAFVLCLMVLKTEKKAQGRALEILRADGLAAEEELADMQKLFKLYNIEYVNNMILALLELIYYILRIFLAAKGGSVSTNSNK